MKSLNLSAIGAVICRYRLLLLLLFPGFSYTANAQSGLSMYDALPITVNACGDTYFSDYQNNSYFYNNYAYINPSPDVWYTFTLTETSLVYLSLCGSYFDTYLSVLDQYGNLVYSNDDDWTYCGSTASTIHDYFTAGTYYIVVEGAGYDSGDFTMNMTVSGNNIPSYGANLTHAIDAGTFSSPGTYSDALSNADNCLGNDMGQLSNDIYYRFTLTGSAQVTLSHCGSGFDTYMYLLDAYGNVITPNDDSDVGPCPGTQSYIETTLSAGTYYVVSEGYGSYTGVIVTSINISGMQSAPVISYTSPSSFAIGMPVSLSPTNTGGAVSAGGQTTSTLAGSGSPGSANGTGAAANFYNPLSVATDAMGNVYVADSENHMIRRITPGGAVTTLAGSGSAGSANGTGTGASFNHPSGLVIDASGNMYVSDQFNHRIRKITPTGVVTTFAGSGAAGFANGTGTAASFNNPIGMVFDIAGNLYVADYSNHRIRMITATGVVSTFAGTGTQGSTNGTALSATFRNPMGLAFNSSGEMFVADRLNHMIRKISASGTVSTLAGSGSIGYTDGTGSAASFNYTNGVAIAASGEVYVVDYLNNMIRKVTQAGVVTTFAGTTTAATVNGTGSEVRFNGPYGICIDGTGNIYVASSGAHVIRKTSIDRPYTISPALPLGLNMDVNTGLISGTPTVASPSTTYTITAYNGSGTGSTTITFAVFGSCPQPSANQNYVITYTPREPELTTAAAVVTASCDIIKVQTSISYFDGLGRPLQSVQVKGNGDGSKDLVQPIAYDAYGRETIKYLPYSTNTGEVGSYRQDALAGSNFDYSTSAQKTFYSQTGMSYKDMSHPYAVTVSEPSPLNRVLEQGAPGNPWQPVTGSTAGHTLKMDYNSNTNGEVQLWSVTSNGAISSATYLPGSLYKTISKDENWVTGKAGTVEEFKDFDGQIVLKRIWENEITSLSTYYIYDDFLNLRYVLPPAVNVSSFTESDAIFLNYIYGYHYDGRNRVIEKKIPGKGWENMVYNMLDLVIITQDARQQTEIIAGFTPGQYHNFVKYDGLGRVIISGVERNRVWNRQQIQDAVNIHPYGWEERSDATGNMHGYSNRTIPSNAVDMDVQVVNYYDTYNIPGIPNNESANYSDMLKGLLTATKTKVLGTADDFLWMVNYYDNKGRIVKVYQQHYKDGIVQANNYDEISNTYSFTDELLESTRKHYVGGIESLFVYNKNTYDHMGRLVKAEQKTGDNSATGNALVMLSKSTYNEVGQLIGKGLHSTDLGSSFAQNLKYRYNERGWLASQSAPLFAMELKYELDSAGLTPQFNGNISMQKWGLNTGLNKQYVYSYDRLNRLTSAVSNDNNNEQISYDVMGNIQSLTRQSHAYGLVDQLGYTYTNGNQLSSVQDANANMDAPFHLPGGTGYTYDVNGNMTSRTNGAHAGNNLSGISYNHLNLPSGMNANNSVISYTYDATGNKLKKLVTTGPQVLNNEYISGIHYEGGALQFVSTGEGRVVRKGADNYSYEYTLADHLGNGRLYFDIQGGVASPIQEMDYYAFGLDIKRFASGTENKYQYNGKEKQDQENMLDYGMRFYDPAIGRFSSIDPMVEKYAKWSTYAYCLNNPIKYVDPRGDTVRITITSNVIGSDKIRVVSSKDFGNYAKNVDTYQMTVTDDVSNTGSDYAVTRDGPLAVKDANGRYTGDDNNKYRMDNTGFEPTGEVGQYQGAIRTDGKAGSRVELRDKNDVNNANVEGRSNVQIHVGGTYTNSEGQRGTTGSLGCFTLGGDNKGNAGRDKFIGDVSGRIKANEEAGKGNVIIITIQKRNEKPNYNQ